MVHSKTNVIRVYLTVIPLNPMSYLLFVLQMYDNFSYKTK